MIATQTAAPETFCRLSVAICIGTYNQAEYLQGAIESALAQTYPIQEIWVSDDCSTDSTPEVMKELCEKYPKVRNVRQPANLGMAGNFSYVLSKPTTDLIVSLDSDDRLEPEYVAVLAALMEQHPEAGVAHAAVNEIDQHGLKRRVRRLARSKLFESSEDALKRNASACRVAANLILYRAQALKDANYYNPNLTWSFSMDWDLYLRIAAKGWGNVYSDQVLSNYRVWEDAQQVRAKRKMSEVATNILVYKTTLEPEFALRGWDVAILAKYRHRRAVRYADAIDSPLFSKEERQEYKILLRELGDSPTLSVAIYLADHGFNPVLRAARKIKLSAKDVVKKAIRIMMSFIR
jgi:glycosyltransferase involved in cell wall biosynthesis